MSRRRKAIVALAAVAVMAGAWLLWPRNVYRYEGKTVEWWFREYARSVRVAPDGTRWTDPRVLNAFEKMGTNAVPFLASRINQEEQEEPTPSILEQWANKLPARFRPVSRDRDGEVMTAALLLSITIQPPRGMLEELLKPALQSQGSRQQITAELVLEGTNLAPLSVVRHSHILPPPPKTP